MNEHVQSNLCFISGNSCLPKNEHVFQSSEALPEFRPALALILVSPRQRSEQKRTSSHTLAQALRHMKGLPQCAQGLLGRSPFLRILGMMGFGLLKSGLRYSGMR
jgi:hypothetical protein